MGIFSPDGALAYSDDHLLCPGFYSRSGNDGIVYDGHADGT